MFRTACSVRCEARVRLAQQASVEARPPWSILSVTLIAFLLPPGVGGAILTVLNLRRMGQVDDTLTRRLVIALIAVFVVGFAALVALGKPGPQGIRSPDPTSYTLLQVGVAFACFSVQREAFRGWRVAHETAVTSPWASAIIVALVYTTVWLVAVAPLIGLVDLSGGSIHP
jgi:hypothetical protein